MSKHIESACCSLEWLHFLLYCLEQMPGVYYTHQRLVFTMRSLSSSSKGVLDIICQTVETPKPNARKSNLWGFQSLGGIIVIFIIIPRSSEPESQICGYPKPSSFFTLLKIECKWVGWLQMLGMRIGPRRRSRRAAGDEPLVLEK